MAYSERKNATEDLAKILFNEAMNITSIAHYARVQANDAELRARYCMSLAEKAVCEADAVHQVAESLTCTSKMVANMTLDYICSLFNQTDGENGIPKDVSSEERVIIDTLQRMGTRKPDSRRTRYSDSDELDEQDTPYKQYFFLNKSTDTEGRGETPPKQSAFKRNMSDDDESSYGILLNNVKFNQSNEVLVEKFQEQFPADSLVENKESPTKDLPKEFDSSHSLPILYEDSYQGHRGTKPLSWAEKKNIRKMQRKLREIDLDGDELDHISESSADHLPDIVDGRLQYPSTINKETLLKSVRFSDLSSMKAEKTQTGASPNNEN